MNVKYRLSGNEFNFKQTETDEVKKLNFLLSNNKGDFLNLGVSENSSKFQGLNVLRKEDFVFFKFLEAIVPKGLEVEEVEYLGYKVKRYFKSNFAIGETGDAPCDVFYLGPTGGVIYEIQNFDGEVFFDIDMRSFYDFKDEGRFYFVNETNGVVLVEYEKKDEKGDTEYKLYFGIKAVNFLHEIIGEWQKREYFYSKQRGSLSERYVYRLLSAKVDTDKKFIIGAGFSEEEVLKQIELLEFHQNELEGFESEMMRDVVKEGESVCMENIIKDGSVFEKPVSQDVGVAYELSKNALYKFLKKDININGVRDGMYAGYPWFNQFWSRDELVGIRGFINLGEINFVKEKLMNYLDIIDEESGMVRRIVTQKDSLMSFDGCFWIAKRLGDLIFRLDEENLLGKVFSMEELEFAYKKLNLVFNRLVKSSWDFENELVKVKDGDSWMDTIHIDFPLDIQVQFLEYSSFMAVLSSMLGKQEDATRFLDLENLMREKIRSAYFRNGHLYNEAYQDKVTSNVFLAYYLYPDLFLQNDWEIIFDNTLNHLRTSWGGISSLSKKDSNYKENYTGENDDSYHCGDSWFWINNVAAIAMADLNEKKYRREITKILVSSTNDILKFGAIGFASEISSASKQKSEGCFAQLWSSSTFIEMVDKLFLKK